MAREREKSQRLHERHQTILADMLREEGNKYCADCLAKGPRWASWNLGVFICIRCAGIHRNLGVHISRVKSVNLDSWTEEQIETISSKGNVKAKLKYEANLPPGFKRPLDDYGVEMFIRNKYEKKLYLGSSATKPEQSKNTTSKETSPQPVKPVTRPQVAKEVQSRPQVAKEVPPVAKEVRSRPSNKEVQTKKAPVVDLLSDQPLMGDGLQQSSSNGQPMLGASPRPSHVKDSILSLYNHQSNVYNAHGYQVYNSQQMHAQQQYLQQQHYMQQQQMQQQQVRQQQVDEVQRQMAELRVKKQNSTLNPGLW